jgi:hypothetical protein
MALSLLVAAALPKALWIGRLYTIEVLSCKTPSISTNDVLIEWRKRIEQYSWKTPRTDWQKEVHKILSADLGSVIRAKILRERVVKNEPALFGEDKFIALGIYSKQKQILEFYITEPCSKLPKSFQASYFVPENQLRIMPTEKDTWPPQKTSDLLIKSTLLPIPEYLRGL